MRPLFCLSVVVASSCATVRVTDARADQPGAVTFYRLGPPAGPYREVGSALLEGSVFVSPDEAERQLREKACEAGADGVVVTREIYGRPLLGTLVQAVFVSRDAS